MKFFLKLLIAYSILCRLFGVIIEKKGLSFNESITYLCAAGKESSYQDFVNKDSSTVVLNQAITNNYVPEPGTHFNDVSYGMAMTDRHPPLFFLIMHAVVKCIGYSMYDGLVVNFILTLLCLALLYKISDRIFQDKLYTYIACAIWMLSSATAHINIEGREYQLLCFFILSNLYLNFKIIFDNDYRLQTFLYFILINAGGFLTHYYYGFLLIPSTLILFMVNKLNKKFLIYMSSLLISLGLFFLIYHDFFLFWHHFSRAPKFETGTTNRIKPLIYTPLEFFSWFHIGRYIYLALLAIYLLYIIVKKNLIKVIKSKLGIISPTSFVFYSLVWYIVFTYIFYLKGISPAQASGMHYFCYIWPLLSIFLVLLFSYFSPDKIKLIFSIHLVQLAISLIFALSHDTYYAGNVVNQNWVSKINSSDILYMETPDRGLMPRTAINFKDNLKVLFGRDTQKNYELLSSFSHISLLIPFDDKGKTDTSAKDLLALFKKNNFKINSSMNEDYIFYEVEPNK